MSKNQNPLVKVIRYIYNRYLLLGFGAMAQGLFASLIIGLIITQLGKIPGMGWMEMFAETFGAKSPVIGAAIGVAVAYGLKSVPLAIFAAAGTGAMGYALGGPVGAYLAAVVSAECGRLVSGRTPVDIVLIPLAAVIMGGLVAKWVGPPINDMMVAFGNVINAATELQPFWMGIVVASLMGLALTAPISSAALAIMMNLSGAAAGAATAGCCAHMVGFAVAGYSQNKTGGLLAQGLGTSMLQVENILRKPAILMPAVVSAAIMGPVATVFLPIQNIASGAGMGTSGLVGPFGVWTAMTGGEPGNWVMIVTKILLICFILPALLAWAAQWLFCKKLHWYDAADMKLKRL